MSKANGVVERIVEKQLSNGKTTYSVLIDNVWYGLYTTKPVFKQGDCVEFEYEEKGNFNNVNTKTIKLVAKTAPATQTPARAYVKDESTQNSIVYQNARSHAVQMLDILTKAGIIDVGTKAKGKQIEVMLTYLDGLTKRFYADTKNLGHAEEEKAPAPPPKEKPAPVEAAEFEDDDIPF